jgi:tRNA A-37 threonylcarbamoyl transferase component Bud32
MRWARFQKKIFRDCSAFKKVQSRRALIMLDRHHDSEAFRNFLRDPEEHFSRSDVQPLKKGNTSTVIKSTIDGREYVIKRYNIKNFWHGIRRCFRPTRAAMSWRLAQYLCLMGIPTAKPIAFIEKRFLGLRTHSYFVMENIEGEHVGQYYAHANRKQEDKKFMADKIKQLFAHLADIKLTHGDLKMTNILIHQNEPLLIDLDGMREHSSVASFERAFNVEWKRFLANWKDPLVYKLFRD